ncbi:MAG: hypothetical protein WKF56_04040, partial [Candidatus Limnocylindrales bacterium]
MMPWVRSRPPDRVAQGWRPGRSPLLAIVFAVGLLGLPGGPLAPAEVHAAKPDLTIVSTARYEVQPSEGRIRVTLDLTLKNRLKDSKTRRYYFDEAFLDVMAGSSGFKLSRAGSGAARVRVVTRAKTHTLLRLRLANRLYSGRTARYRLRFDLDDPGGAATRDLRVGDSFVSFPVWAYATDGTPGSSVSVVLPKGYQARVEVGDLGTPVVDDQGRMTFRSAKLAKPLDFFAYLRADRPGAFREERIRPAVDDGRADLTVRAWVDDGPWAERVTGLLGRALPVLGREIGLAWPHDTPFTVEESVSRSSSGYAGLFDPGEGRVEIAYYANDFVVLHEAAHGWFNGALLADRWANEAFASYYAGLAAADLGVVAAGPGSANATDPAQIPLNAWGRLGSEPPSAEDDAYAASLALARSTAGRAGPAGLSAVWAAAQDRIGPYQPPDGSPERVSGAPDWRALLDLLEDRTGQDFDDLWRTWVARPSDLPLLDARAAARARYAAVMAEADGWRLPRAVRDALRAWRFEDATTVLDAAQNALRDRRTLDAAASAAGLTVPATMRLAFEDDDGFDDTVQEARAELDTIARYEAALAARPPETTPLLTLGLWDETPESDLAAARDAFGKGNLAASIEASEAAAGTWGDAAALGQSRALRIGLLVLA